MRNTIHAGLLGLIAVFATIQDCTAETVYVIDKLLVGVHAEKSLDSPIVKALPTGTQLEVLKREGDLAQVRGPEGVTGWVDAVYLTKDQPASIVVEMLDAQNRKLVQDLKTAQAKIEELSASSNEAGRANANAAPATDELASLRKEKDSLQQMLNAERARLNELQQELAALRSQPTVRPEVVASVKEENEALKRELEEIQLKAIQEAETLSAAPTPAVPMQAGLHLSAGMMIPHNVLLVLGVIILASSFAGGAWLMDFLQRRRHGGFRI